MKPCYKTVIQTAFTIPLIFSLGSLSAQEDNETIEELIVIGTPGGSGIDKKDVSFSVSVLDDEAIEQFSPKSTADLLKSVPGVWVESSGGVAGANIDVRGLPGGGDAPFVTFALNGSPLYGTETLSFFEQSSIFRIDETIAQVEGLRGGPGAIFGKGEPGLTVNFELKRGHEETEGRVKYTTSDYDLQRLDGYISGQIAENTYYMIGGYVQQSPGIRDAQFNSEEGYQFTLNLTHELENGEINIYSRVTDDHGQWYLPFSLSAGLDAGEFSQLGNATRQREITVNSAGDTQIFDFGEGRGWDGSVSGVNIEFEIGDGWFLRNNLGYTDGDANTFGFVPAGSSVSAAAVSDVIGASVVTTGGRQLGAGDFTQTYGHWVVLKELRSFANDFSINKQFGDHDITFGVYQSSYSSDDTWYLGNPIAVHNFQNGDTLANVTPQDIAAAGGDAGFSFGLVSNGDARTTAFYIADSWQVNDAWRIDAGIRAESLDIDYVLDTGPGFADGVRDQNVSLDDDETAWTLGANWDVNEQLGVFARYSEGYLFPHFDDVRENNLEVNSVEQFELGVKYVTENLDIFLTAFYNTNDSFDSTVGSSVAASSFETESKGIEIDSKLIFGNFNIGISGVFQDAEVTDSTTVADIGNTVLRQPDYQIRIAPTYSFEFANFTADLYGAVTFVDDRFSNQANTVVLPSYDKVDLGLRGSTESGFFFQIHADNIGDSDGITEGDPRNPSAPNGRPILGRSVRFSVGYDF